MSKDEALQFKEEASVEGTFVCSECGLELFVADKKFEAGCGFPSFWMHISDNVKFNELDTYGRHRIQLLCKGCEQHLGHLFANKFTPTKVRYCINGNAIKFRSN